MYELKNSLKAIQSVFVLSNLSVCDFLSGWPQIVLSCFGKSIHRSASSYCIVPTDVYDTIYCQSGYGLPRLPDLHPVLAGFTRKPDFVITFSTSLLSDHRPAAGSKRAISAGKSCWLVEIVMSSTYRYSALTSLTKTH
jgi:hypothetical protein